MLLGVTMGDAAGVGPEIILHAYRNGEINYPVMVFGDLAVLAYCNDLLGWQAPLRKATTVTDYQPDFLNVYDLGLLSKDGLVIGKVDRQSGAAARAYVVTATQAALNHEIDAIVTLPMNKEATQLSDPTFTGHTEMIAELCGVADVTMMLASNDLIVTHVSTHVALSEVVRLVKQARIGKVIDLTCETLRRFITEPRIAVAGLNPHAGEHGLFGNEEESEIRPAVEAARERGLNVTGPVPPDTVFYAAVRQKRFDAVVCMYHDQGHIAMKLLDFEGGVNITLGLPIIRTSVDHGTAFDIAYQGKAATGSFVNALGFAVKLIR